MFSALHKSRQISSIALDRVGDYLDLVRVEAKIRGKDMGVRMGGLALAALFGLLTTIFFGLAIIVSFWDTSYRALAAWFVVLLYGGIAGYSLSLYLKHLRSQPLATMLRSELRRDIEVIKESL